jgi:hypothetical protein
MRIFRLGKQDVPGHEGQGDDRTARHEVRQRVIERAAGMHSVKLLGLMLGNFQHLHGENAEVLLLELLDNVAHGVPFDRVGLHNRKSALQCFHRSISVCFSEFPIYKITNS